MIFSEDGAGRPPELKRKVTMLRTLCAASLGALLSYSPVALACGGYGELPSISRCQSVEPEVSGKAIAQLRGMGPAGLEKLLKEHAARTAAGSKPEELARLRAAIDAVAQQKDAHA